MIAFMRSFPAFPKGDRMNAVPTNGAAAQVFP
jgi:hypothetical protein